MEIQLRKGFSLIELMLATTLILLFTLALVSVYKQYTRLIGVQRTFLMQESLYQELESVINTSPNWFPESAEYAEKKWSFTKANPEAVTVITSYSYAAYIDGNGDGVDDTWVEITSGNMKGNYHYAISTTEAKETAFKTPTKPLTSVSWQHIKFSH
ncbi:prepilin-type N-terminal cleavage/methylation domain-containing protein [Alteromonas sediminis]|uniref:Prepilin-type N-terminal cleavage/methylation domain-containing protein n=1 Tax=Alteromonas sediminis TaxID=2259342 RepID=A0A3N5Y5S7_9ALTE|nr:prepilin-type N-terminal cleavage/methylation domain-containing protein [Alteromonas sediminis]RPJ65619.1 prepilin-type N-terminal cleavage/methylation domain-containing protein [Alteromonas sediminis]